MKMTFEEIWNQTEHISIDYDDKIFNTATRHKSGLPDSCSIHFAGGSSNLENMNKAYKLWKELP